MNHRLLNKYLFLFGVGGLLYILIELIWRGRSHWTMFLLGGICFVFLGLINEVIPWQMPLWQQILIGADEGSHEGNRDDPLECPRKADKESDVHPLKCRG